MFVPIIRTYRGSLIAGMRPTADREEPFEGYACDYHKAVLRSYSSIAPPIVGRYETGQAYLAAQGHVFIMLDGCGQAANWHALEEVAQQVISRYTYALYGVDRSPCPPELTAQALP